MCDLDTEVMWKEAVACAKRRERLAKSIPLCPKCSNEQVQLTSYMDCLASWRCRICYYRFNYEPRA